MKVKDMTVELCNRSEIKEFIEKRFKLTASTFADASVETVFEDEDEDIDEE
jgi:hypothetical protein